MPLPPLLLERLKKRRIIQELQEGDTQRQGQGLSSRIDESSIESRYQEPEELVGGEATGEDQEQEEIIAEDYSDDEAEDHDDPEEEEVDEAEQESESNFEDSIIAARHGSDTSVDGEKDEPQHQQITEIGAQKSDAYSNQHVDSNQIVQSVIGCPNKYNIYHECSQYCLDKYSKLDDTSPTVEQRKQLALVLRNYPISNEWTVVYDPGVKTFYFWNIISNLVSWFPPGMNGFVSLSADQIKKSMREMEQTQNEC